jgi:hypothetical protein
MVPSGIPKLIMNTGWQPEPIWTRSGRQVFHPSIPSPQSQAAQKQRRINDTAQMFLEKVYADINSLWRQACEFPATFKLRGFSEILNFPSGLPSRYTDAKNILGEALLCLLLRSERFVNLLSQKPSSSNDEYWGHLLILLKNNETSLGQFSLTRGLDWFKDAPFPEVALPETWGCPLVRHPHEVYRADDESLKRCVFQNDNDSSYDMENITENVFHEQDWSQGLPKPKYWPDWQPFPGDPSICPPDGYGPYALCHGGCRQLTGIRDTTCTCVAEKTYKPQGRWGAQCRICFYPYWR